MHNSTPPGTLNARAILSSRIWLPWGNTLSRESIVSEVRAEISRLQQVLALLAAETDQGVSVQRVTDTAARPRRQLSAAGAGTDNSGHTRTLGEDSSGKSWQSFSEPRSHATTQNVRFRSQKNCSGPEGALGEDQSSEEINGAAKIDWAEVMASLTTICPEVRVRDTSE